MTALIVVASLLLVCAPTMIVYKMPVLSDFDVNTLLAAGSTAFTAAQALKMVAVATLLPGSREGALMGTLSAVLEILVSLIDLVALWVASTYVAKSSRDKKYLGVALGWSAAESAFSRALPVFYTSRGAFTWQPVLLGVDSNASMLAAVAMCCALHAYRTRRGGVAWLALGLAVGTRAATTGTALLLGQPESTAATLLLSLLAFALSRIL